MLDPYEVVFFDAGGTLFRPYPSVGEIYGKAAKKFGTSVDAAKIQERFDSLWHERDGLVALDVHASEKSEKDWWRAFVHEIFFPWGGVRDFESFFDGLYDHFGSAACWRLYPDTLEVLESLKGRGKRLAVISNWDHRLFTICEGLGITPYFEFILASAVIGAAKPSPKIFMQALKQSEVFAGNAVHIGDSLEDDVKGARAVGMTSILIDRNMRSRKAPEHFEGVRTVTALKELIS